MVLIENQLNSIWESYVAGL
uniref:Uncharacterized protein n=1 Tax=Anguilla anguilla TaxID=7936 RepID=A0A0E9T1A7_ANGAN